MRPRRRWLAAAAVAFVAIAHAAPAVGSDVSEFECEEAAAHLADCCPGLDPTTIQCSYTFDCDGDPSNDDPVISASMAECIEGQSCDELRASGTCDLAIEGSVQCL